MNIKIIGLPTAGRMNRQQVCAYRALLAFQLRAACMDHRAIADVLNLRSKNHSRELVAKGRRVMTDCIIGTVMP